MRWSIGPFSLPRQYAPATFVSLNAPSRFVEGTCGPRHRSVKHVAPSTRLRYTDTPPPAEPASPASSVEPVAGADLLDDLLLVRLVGEQRQRVVERQLVADEALVVLDDLAHPLLDALERLLVEGLAAGQVEVVVEAVGDRRTDRVLRAREELRHRLGEHVRGRVPQHLAAVVALGRDERERDVVVEGPVEIDPLAVGFRRERRLRQSVARSPRRRRAASCPAEPNARNRRAGSP